MKKLEQLLRAIKSATGKVIEQGEDGFSCMLPRIENRNRYTLFIIVSWGEKWDHISVRAQKNKEDFTPFWGDMVYVKHLFFKESETVIQYHPPKKCYVNIHRNVLHLWRSQDKEIELPPQWMV